MSENRGPYNPPPHPQWLPVGSPTPTPLVEAAGAQKPALLTERQLADMLVDAGKANKAVVSLLDRTYSLCVPPQPDDADMLLCRVADSVPVLVENLAAARAETATLRARLDAEARAAGEAKERHLETVQALLREWRDESAELTEALEREGPHTYTEADRLNHRVFFDLKSVELTGRRLEPAGIYAGIPALKTDPPASPAGRTAGAGEGGEEVGRG